MSFPTGVRTRIVSVGATYPSIDLPSNLSLSLRVKLTASRSLIWNGEQIPQLYNILTQGSPNNPAKFEAVVTDMDGMIDASTMQQIDISGGANTHLLTARLRVFLGMNIVSETIRTFPVPTGTGELDLDTMIIPDPELGILVPVVGVSDEQVADAVTSYLDQNSLATPEFVNTQLSNHVESTTPHPVYDDMIDFTLIFDNGLV